MGTPAADLAAGLDDREGGTMRTGNNYSGARWAHAARRRPALPPIDKRYSQTIIGEAGSGRTRRECWSATTRDGLWGFDRIEVPGTPWEVVYLPLRAPVGLTGTLRAARQMAQSMTVRDVIEYRLSLAEERDRDRARAAKIPGRILA
jgi:hypothetical protein